MTEHRYKLIDNDANTTIPRVILRGAVIVVVVVEVGAYDAREESDPCNRKIHSSECVLLGSNRTGKWKGVMTFSVPIANEPGNNSPFFFVRSK